MEIKRVTEDFGSRGEMSLSTLYEIEDIMYMIEMLFDECDAELANAGMPTLGYKKQPIGTMRDHLVILLNYVQHAHPQCYSELDHPLYVGFKNEATQTLSEIVLEDITTDNTFEMQKYEEIIDVNGQYYRSRTKKNLTMADFLGLDAVVPGNGIPVVENVETIGWFTALFRVDYESMGAAVESLDQMLEIYLHGGEFSHKEYHPVGNFVSGILDVTIIKPFIESIYGKDLITGEKLTDFERGMQLVNAAVGAVTFGQGALALNFAEMSGKEIATSLLKTWALEAVSDMSAYTVGYALDELGMPASVTFLASLATGCSVSVKAGKYVFQDASSNIVKELDADGMQTFLKELDVDLGDMAWGGGKGTNKTSIDAYESLLGTMSDEELKRYLKFLEDGSQAGLTPAELMGIRKVDEYLALGRVDYDEVLALRKGVSGGAINVKQLDEIIVEFNYKSKYNETEFARQLTNQQKGMNKLTIQEYLDNRQAYINQGRTKESNAAQKEARAKALIDKVSELQNSGLSIEEAEEQAHKWLDTQAVLHDPDQVAGGYAGNIGGIGDKGVNSSIGVQWRYRIDDVDEQIHQLAENMTEIEKKSTYLNMNLIYKGGQNVTK